MSGGARLGRGFEDLIPTELVEEEFDVTADDDTGRLREIKISEIIRDEEQPRRDFRPEAIEVLAGSIREHGVLQPIVVTAEGDKYKIVAGERRWRAAKLAGLAKMPVIVRSLTDQNRLELSLIENVQREDLNAIEMATAYAKLKNQFNLNSGEIAARIGKSESAVVNTMRLLGLPEEAKKMMVEHGLSEGVMRPLIMATPEVIAEVMPKIVEEGWSARKVEQYMVGVKGRTKRKTVAGVEGYEEEAKTLSDKMGMKVRIQVSGRGSGSFVVKFRNEGELKKLIETLNT